MSFSSLKTSSAWLVQAFLVVGLLGGGRAARAQQAAPTTIRLQPEDLARGLNGAQHNFYFLPPGATGENYLSAGFFGQKLRPYLAGNSAALTHLADYRRQKTQFLVDRLVLVGAVAVYGQQVLSDDKQQYFNSAQQVAIGVAAASLVATIFINRNTNRYLQQAVEAYNEDAGAGRHGGLWQRARPSNLGVQCTPAGQPLLALSWSLR